MIEVQGDTVLFHLICPDATWACIAGDFNNWSVDATPMREVRPGEWEARVKLAPGEYRYRYVTSNRGWLTDWAGHGLQRNPYGDWDSLVTVAATGAQSEGASDQVGETRMLRRVARFAQAPREAEPRVRSALALAAGTMS